MFVSQIFEECAEILGTTINEKVFRKISQAVQTLMESGHWTHSTAEVDICTGWDCMSVTLPRGVDTPLAVNVDGSPVYFRNRLFQYHVNKGGQYNPVTWAWDDRGYVATAMEVLQPSQLVAVAEVENDVGKVIRVLGNNKGNVPLRSQLENGTPVDGLLVPIHSVNDFPYGVILPDSATVETRVAAIDPLTQFTTTTPHTLDSGEGVNITNLTGTIPIPLSNGQVLYLGVIDAVTIQLFSDQNNAKNGNFPLKLQSIVNAGTLRIKDSKPSAVQTALQFSSPPVVAVSTANPVVFPTAPLPIPLKDKVTYFINMLDATNAQVYETFEDAQNNTNPVFLTGSTSPITLEIRKEFLPETKLVFSVLHYFNQGDQVQVFTAGGVLPSPLLANQNYFVNVIDGFSITLHESQQDANSSTPQNPVNAIQILDAGSGTNFVVKILPSSFKTGTTSQVTASGLSIAPPTGSGASFTAKVTGSVTAVTINSQGAGYITAPTIAFPAPPPPPVGSGQQSITATGYSIINTITNKVEQIVITNPGLGYETAPQVIISGPNAPIIQANVLSITRQGSVATVTTTAPHGFESGYVVTISGAGEAQYNISASITKIGSTQFTYVVNTSSLIRTVTQITRVGQVATATTSGNHGFSNGDNVTIAGASASEYNVTEEIITFVSANQFSYAVQGSPTTPVNNAGITATRTSPVSPATGTGIQAIYTPVTASATATAILRTSIVSDFVKINGGNGYVEPPQVIITGNGTGATAQALINNTVTVLLSITESAGVALATTSGNHSFTNGQVIKISGATPNAYNANHTITGVTLNTFTFNIPAATGNASIAGFATGSDIVSLQLISTGTGYTSPPTVQIIPSTGVFVEFSSTGTLPSPLVAGTAYRAEAPLNQSTGTFTIKNADYTELNITGGGSGTFSTVISRTFGIDFTDRWLGDFTNLQSGQGFYFGSDFVLPTTSPAISNTVQRFLNIVSPSVAKVYTTSGDAISGGNTGLISVVSFGVGQTYYGIRNNVSPLPFNNLIIPDSVLYLQEDEIVRFSTSGTLPSPLAAATDYKIKLVGNGVRVYTTTGSLISLTSAGTGAFSLDIERVITPKTSTSIVCERSLFETGQAVTVRAASGDVLPNGLLPATTYYVRRIDENSFELYDTIANAKGTGTTGRKEYRTSGTTVDSTFFVDAVDEATFVKSISQIEKPLTDGYVYLYAWDYGRSNDMTLIGHYHPSEVNPQYRRIRIGKPCAWVRLAYRVSAPFITSMYDYIPIEHERAIIAAIHAVDMEDKDFAEQSARYWGIAFQYLRNQQEYIDGHAMTPPQINNITYGDGTDPVIF